MALRHRGRVKEHRGRVKEHRGRVKEHRGRGKEHRGRGKERCKGHRLHSRVRSRVRKGQRRRKGCRMEEHNRVAKGASTTSMRGGVWRQEVGWAGGGKGSNSVTPPSPFALRYD
jgi:hypothetical protein